MKVRRLFLGALGVIGARIGDGVRGDELGQGRARREGGVQGVDRRRGTVRDRSGDAAGRRAAAFRRSSPSPNDNKAFGIKVSLGRTTRA